MDGEEESVGRGQKINSIQHISVSNMAPFAISSSLILMIHDNMINGTNHIFSMSL
jgi:hypothetical protein